jgi:hypothetical protein
MENYHLKRLLMIQEEEQDDDHTHQQHISLIHSKLAQAEELLFSTNQPNGS